jgi:hypothetical protein
MEFTSFWARSVWGLGAVAAGSAPAWRRGVANQPFLPRPRVRRRFMRRIIWIHLLSAETCLADWGRAGRPGTAVAAGRGNQPPLPRLRVRRRFMRRIIWIHLLRISGLKGLWGESVGAALELSQCGRSHAIGSSSIARVEVLACFVAPGVAAMCGRRVGHLRDTSGCARRSRRSIRVKPSAG